MKYILRALTLSAVALFLASATALAGTDVIKVNGLGVLRGDATHWDPQTEILTFVTEDGKEHKIPAKDLDRLSAYKLAKSRADMMNPQDLVKLGNFARAIELYAYAGRHYNNAIRLDPSLKDAVAKEQAAGRREAAEYCMKQAKEAVKKRDIPEAERWLTMLVNKLPDEPLAKQAATILSEYYKKNHEAKDDHLEAKHKDALEKDLKKGKKHYDNMLEKIHAGLTGSAGSSKAKREFESAYKEGEKALHELDRVQKKRGADDPQVQELFGGYRKLVNEHMVDAQLHLAASLSTQTDYNGALTAINKALAIDPQNRDAKAARARVEDAVANGGIFRRWW